MVTVIGLSRFKTKIRRRPRRTLEEIGGVLYREAEEVMTISKEVFVPVDTGALKASGRVQLPVYSRNNVEIELGYGGPSAPYALRVHEDLAMAHPRGGQAKYLEEPARAAVPRIKRKVRAAARRRGGG